VYQEASNFRRTREIREYVAAVRSVDQSGLPLDGERLEDWSIRANNLAGGPNPLRAEVPETRWWAIRS
jgi:hypothetical protein